MRRDGSRYWGSGLMMLLRSGDPPLGLLKIMKDETARRRADKQKQLLIDELNHRVKNTLTIVQAMAEQTVKTALSLPEFTDTFRGCPPELVRAGPPPYSTWVTCESLPAPCSAR